MGTQRSDARRAQQRPWKANSREESRPLHPFGEAAGGQGICELQTGLTRPTVDTCRWHRGCRIIRSPLIALWPFTGRCVDWLVGRSGRMLSHGVASRHYIITTAGLARFRRQQPAQHNDTKTATGHPAGKLQIVDETSHRRFAARPQPGFHQVDKRLSSIRISPL